MISAKNKKTRKILYISILIIIITLIVFLPFAINKDIQIGSIIIIDEDIAESVLIATLLTAGFVFYRYYESELENQYKEIKTLTEGKNNVEYRLNDAFRYIGSINIQIQEIKSIFSELEKYPEDREDFKKILHFLANKALSIVNAPWAVIRIIEPGKLRTLREFFAAREGAKLLKYSISNKELIEKGYIEGCQVVGSGQMNLNVKVFCIIPIKDLSEDQKILLKAIVSQLEMLFIVFTSQYYKENKK